MEEKEKAIETNAQPIATEETAKVTSVEDLEERNATLEAEKAKLIEESANYKLAYLKEKNKNRDEDNHEDQDDRLRNITRQELANSRLAEIAKEQDQIIKRALKENKELKLASLNKTGVSAVVGTHVESATVKDTLITPEQLSAFKARGWSDKDIERYKRNLQKNAVR